VCARSSEFKIQLMRLAPGYDQCSVAHVMAVYIAHVVSGLSCSLHRVRKNGPLKHVQITQGLGKWVRPKKIHWVFLGRTHAKKPTGF